MSGHSKWSTIKRQKGVADIKRGQQFTKLANAIVISVRQNGGDSSPESNFKLRLAIDKARSYNMPKENIERAIAKGKGEGDSGELHEMLYEGFAPGGAAIMVEAVTDNKQRTVSEVKNTLEKNGGNMGNQGSVSYLFKRLGEVVAAKGEKTADELFEIALDLNSTDYLEEDGDVVFYVEPGDLFASKKLLEERGMIVNSAELVYKPQVTIDANEESKTKLMNLIDKLEDLSDVQNVFTNIVL